MQAASDELHGHIARRTWDTAAKCQHLALADSFQVALEFFIQRHAGQTGACGNAAQGLAVEGDLKLTGCDMVHKSALGNGLCINIQFSF
jgi:hypothetical protein